MGMCDSIALSLGGQGYNALKLVPYGDFDEVLPWLLRQARHITSSICGADTDCFVVGVLRQTPYGKPGYSWSCTVRTRVDEEGASPQAGLVRSMTLPGTECNQNTYFFVRLE